MPKLAPRTLGVIAAIALVPIFGFLIWRTSGPDEVGEYVSQFGKPGEAAAADFAHIPSLPIAREDGKFVIRDTSESGIRIRTGGQEEPPAETYHEVTLPEDYREPVEVKLADGRVIRMKDTGNTERFSADILETPPQEAEGRTFWERLFAPASGGKPSYVRYQSGRKSILYTYQKDGATGERLLKQWTLYEDGGGTEKESYAFENAKLKLLDDGRVGVYYFDEQVLKSQQAAADAPQDLLERAQRTLGADLLNDAVNGEPDFIIPRPAFYDKDGAYHEGEWKAEGENLSLEFSVDESLYPLALDPTLSFAAPQASNSGTVINGESDSTFGSRMVVGDFNSDGKTDLAVAGWRYSTYTGRVYVFYNDGGYPGNAGTADVIITGEATTNYFGTSLLAGDFNSDGTTDLVVGASAYSSYAGRVYIFYNDGAYPSAAGSADVKISGAAGNTLGDSLASGDLNNDGKIDLVAGASGDDGHAYIFYNDGSYPASVSSADVTIGWSGSFGNFGSSLAVADLNQDGESDLAVNSYGYGITFIFYNDGSYPSDAASADTSIDAGASLIDLQAGDMNGNGRMDLVAVTETGVAYIVYNDGSLPTNYYTNADVEITESGDGIISAATIGDFNDDGKDDLAFTNSFGQLGYIFYNDGSYPSSSANADVIISGDTESFGYSLAAGDFNGDGAIDLVAGAQGGSFTSYTGRAYIFYSQNGQVNTGTAITGEASSRLGSAFATGDFNSDGKTDLAVGAYGYSTNTGRAYIFYNDGALPTTASSADVTITGGATNNYFGAALAAGDFNADGKTDLAVGAYGYSTNTGRAYIFYNDGSIPTTAGTADVTITGGTTSDKFGYALAAADLNGNGTVDLAVSAREYSSATGRAYIFYNDGTIPTTAGTADVTITGAGTTDYFGDVLAVGDLNADGKKDLIVGAYPYFTTGGRVYVYYNDGSIPTTAGTADVTISGEASNSFFGGGIAVGDVNADGREDLLVGAAGHSTNTGRTYLFYNDGSIPTTAATADMIISGEATSNYFGNEIITGDFNADGRTDFAVNAYGYSTNTGRVYYFYNDGNYPAGAASADVILTGEATSSYFGFVLAAGDINSDGRTNLISGAFGYSSNAGRVYVYETRENFAWELQEQTGTAGRINPTGSGQELRITGVAQGDWFGYGQAAGDFNADGKTDLAVSARTYNSSQGRVYIFYNDGNYSESAANADVVITGNALSDFGSALAAGDFNADGKIDLAVGAYSDAKAFIFYNDGSYPATYASADITITGSDGGNFGVALAAADFNADGKTDLAVGNQTYFSSSGIVHIFYNDGSIPTASSSADVTITGQSSLNYFGIALASGDMNADGKVDLIVGASNYSSATGRSYIFYNDGSIPTTAGTADVTITGDASSSFGRALVTGDFNADSKTDLAVGAYQYSSSAGRAYIFLNDGIIPTSAATADTTISGATSSSFGYSLASGDFNSDGRIDLAVGAYQNSGSIGAVYVFSNDGSIPTSYSSADMTIAGESSSTFGYSLASGDFNADGKTDLSVGGISYSSSTGRTYVYTFNDSTATGDTSSKFGTALAVGDFNNDGKDDLAVGAPEYSSNAGRVYLFYQKSSQVSVAVSGADATITGSGTQKFGGSMAVGDFDTDGDDDLWVAAGIGAAGGETYLFYQDGTWPSAVGSADVTMNNSSYYNQTNQGLGVGDFNADGKDDLAVGTMDSLGSTSHVSFFYQDGSWPTDITSEDVDIAGGQADSAYSLAVGDFNKDGKDDIAAGGAGFNGVSDRSLRIYYQDGTWPATPTNADVTITSSGSLGFSGYLAAGDFDADGDDDLVAGGHANSSSIYFFYQDGSWPASAAAADLEITGSSKVWPLAADMNADGRTDIVTGDWEDGAGAGRVAILHNDGSYPTAITSADRLILGEGGSSFGTALASGDFNSDGRADLVIGNRAYSSSAGRVNIIITETKALDSSQVPTQAAEVKGSFKLKGNFRLK